MSKPGHVQRQIYKNSPKDPILNFDQMQQYPVYNDGLVQDYGISSASALEIPQYYTKLSIQTLP